MIEELSREIYSLEGQYRSSKKTLKSLNKQQKDLEEELREWEQAVAVMEDVGIGLQSLLKERLCSLTTKAIHTIFDDRYSFDLRLTQKKRGLYAEPILVDKDGNELDPISQTGGGVVDVVSFALRICFLLLSSGTMRMLALDEPFRFVSTDLQPAIADLIESLASDNDLCFLIITHEEELAQE